MSARRGVVWAVLALTASGPLLAAESPATAAAEWTRFRGPNGSGISPAMTLPTAWTDHDYRWKISLPGKGNSSPVLWGERLFITCGDAETAQRRVLCVSVADGRTLWERDYPSQPFRQNRDNSYATSTPAADGRHVYVYWTTPAEVVLMALDHQGREAWRRNLGTFTAQHGSGTSPIVFEGLVVLDNDQEAKSSLLALDCQTGQTRWEVPRQTGKAVYATPCLWQPEHGPAELIFSSQAHGLTGLNPRTGKVQWEFPEAFPVRVVGSPVVARDWIVGACGEGGVGRRLVAVRPGSARQAPALVYEMKSSIPYVPTPVAQDGLLYLWADNGLVACHRAANGERRWQLKLRDSFYSSPVWANGKLYGVSKNGVVYVLAAGADKGELLASIPLGEPSFATPAIAHEVIYFRTRSHLFALGGPLTHPTPSQ